MNADRTQFIHRKALIESGLTDEEADIVVNRAQENSDAIERFEALEEDIKRVKMGAKWIGALLLANYSGNILDWFTR